MSKQRLLRSSRLWWIAVILLGFAAISWTTLISSFAGNVGLLLLSRSMTQVDLVQPAHRDDPSLIRAEQWLQIATNIDAANRGTWRGLGFDLAMQGRDDEANAAWRIAGMMGQDFVQRGETAQQVGQYEDALKWYERAEILAPENRDSRVLAGRVFVIQRTYERALMAFQGALAFSRSTERFGDSDVYYQIGLLYQLRFQPSNLVEALAAYNNAITRADFHNGSWRADAYYRRGEVTLWLERSLEAALADFEKAVALNPDHLFARIHLASTYYDVYKDFPKAEAELLSVIGVDPKNKWAYLYLGRIYEAENMIVEAVSAYRQVLLIDANDTFAQERLDTLKKR